jgi:required for meiotic nuclear division protein 1
VQALQRRGELIASEKSILTTVGFTLAVREAILAKLSLFDDPAETWQSETLSRLHNLLCEHFDIQKRLSALHEKLTFLSDLNTTLMSLLQNRTSHRLEWVVILLILIEVIFSFYHFFSSFH